MRTAVTLLVIGMLGIMLSGCSGAVAGETGADAAAARTEKGATAPEGNTGSTKISDPTGVKPGDSVTVAPADPNDPKFKADPKLSGGN